MQQSVKCNVYELWARVDVTTCDGRQVIFLSLSFYFFQFFFERFLSHISHPPFVSTSLFQIISEFQLVKRSQSFDKNLYKLVWNGREYLVGISEFFLSLLSSCSIFQRQNFVRLISPSDKEWEERRELYGFIRLQKLCNSILRNFVRGENSLQNFSKTRGNLEIGFLN